MTKKKEIFVFPEEINIKYLLYWENKIFDFKKKSVTSNINIFQYAPEEIKKNKELVLKAVEKINLRLDFIDNSLINKQFILEYIKKRNYLSYYFEIPKEFINDEEIFFEFVKKSKEVFSLGKYHYPPKFSNRDNIKKILSINGLNIKHLTQDLELATIAIKQNFESIKYVKKEFTQKILNDKKICLKLLEHDLTFFEYFSLKMRNDQEIVDKALKNQKLILNTGIKTRRNEEFILKNKNNFYIYDCLPESIRKNEDVMIELIIANNNLLYYIDNSLKNIFFYAKAVNKCPKIYKILRDEYKEDNKIISNFLLNGTEDNLKFIPEKKRKELVENMPEKSNELQYIINKILKSELDETINKKEIKNKLKI